MMTVRTRLSVIALRAGVLPLWFAAQALASSPTLPDPGQRPCPPLAEDTHFFPAGTFGQYFPEAFRRDDWDVWTRQWYSEMLRAMQEPSLSCAEYNGEEAYRFLFLPSFSQPMAVTVTRVANESMLRAIVLVGGDPNGAGPSPIERRFERKLSDAEWARLKGVIDKFGFWQMPTDDGSPPDVDGTKWVVEGRTAKSFNVVNRYRGEALRAISLVMLDLANLESPDWSFD